MLRGQYPSEVGRLQVDRKREVFRDVQESAPAYAGRGRRTSHPKTEVEGDLSLPGRAQRAF